MDNEIIELHPPLVTFASIDYDGDPPPVQNPPPPAPYDHKNLVVVNRNDLESILVSKNQNVPAQKQAMKQQPNYHRVSKFARQILDHNPNTPL